MPESEGGGPFKGLKGKNRKPILFIGGAAAVYVVYRYWKASSAASTAAVVPAGPTDTSVAQGGGGSAMPNDNIGNQTLNTPRTNADWTQNAVQLLSNQGWDAATVTAALGKYLGGQALNDSEVTIVQSALAIAGAPPVGSYGIIRMGGSVTPPTPTPTPDKDKAPTQAPTGLHTISNDQTSFTAQWDAVPGATRYRVSVPQTGDQWQTASLRHYIPVPANLRKQQVTVRVEGGNAQQQWGPAAQYWSRTK